MSFSRRLPNRRALLKPPLIRRLAADIRRPDALIAVAMRNYER